MTLPLQPPLNPAEPFLEADFPVPVYDLDSLGRLAVRAFADYLFETASRHAQRLGVGVQDLEPLGLTWMISRLRFTVASLPSWGETVRVTTWPSSAEPLYAHRDFELQDGQGRPVGAAISAWMIIERDSRRPMRVPGTVRNLPFPDRPRALPGGFTRLPKAELPCRESDFTVRSGDVDANRHAGAVTYLEWILESLPPELLPDRRLAELEIQYRAECVRGETVRVLAREEDPAGATGGFTGGRAVVFLHRVLRPADGRELALARTVWR